MGCLNTSCFNQRQVSNNISNLKLDKRTRYSNLELQQTPSGIYVRSPRSKMKLQLGKNQYFISHHLQNQLCLSPYATSQKIRARQIIEHYMFNDLSHKKVAGNLSTSKLTQFALKAWFQRTFLNCIQKAEDIFFNKRGSYDQMRQRLAQQYIFQIYKMGSFINSGFGKFTNGKHRVQIPLSLILLNSDSALYQLLTRLQQKYPLVQQNENISYPDVKPMTQNINLLKLINSRCYQDPQHLNIQHIFDDLKFLIDQANTIFKDFKRDMLVLLGAEALVDCKVKRSEGEKMSYNASAIRRVFIKWSETLIERIPDIYLLQEFLDFIKSKKDMANTFIFKSLSSETTHQKVISYLSSLLSSIKYQIASNQPRQQFGLFLYDLLRCKTTRNTGAEVASLLENLKTIKKTASGKRFQVVRVKNRFKNATRDILINFRYGQHLVGEAQLCIDTPHDSKEIAKKIKFRHYLYELERGLFGPTFQLIMQYQDFSRQDITVNLEAQGSIKQRITKTQNIIKKANRKCPQKHDMISIKGNIFMNEKFGQKVQKQEQSFNCDFCYQQSSINKQHHYCYYCSLFYCLKCIKAYENTDTSKFEISCNQQHLLIPIRSLEEITTICKKNKAIILVVYRKGRSACRLFLDQIIYILSTYASQGQQIPQIYTVNIANKSLKEILPKKQITRLPTTMILNQDQEIQVTLVGSTFHDIQGIIEVQNRIKQNLPKGIQVNCNICSQKMSTQKKLNIKLEDQCQICMGTNKIDDIGDFIRAFKYSHHDFYCANGHTKCGYCSYLSNNKPSYFRDHTGRTYLSNKLPLPLPSFCSKLHIFKIIPQPQSFTCSKCLQKIVDNNDQQIKFCQSCNTYICLECMETQVEDFNQKQIKEAIKSVEIVSHLVQDEAQESWPCGCGKLFLKVYQTRKKDNYKQNMMFKSLLLKCQYKSWACYVCKQQTSKLTLHLACFYCQYAKKVNNQISHIQICMNCSMRSGLIGHHTHQKVIKQKSNLTCRNNHQIFKTSIRKGRDSFFKCCGCNSQFYSYTERYQCEECKFDCCIKCSSRILINPNPAVTTRNCSKKHELSFKNEKTGLQFCNECFKYINGSHFACLSDCRYFLCLECASHQ